MPRTYLKTKKTWTDRMLQDAFAERLELGTSFEKLAKKYHIPVGTLHRHMSKHNSGIPHLQETRGKKPTFSEQEIAELKECIISLASLGFAPSIRDLGLLVQNYVVQNDIEKAKKVFNHNGLKGLPGPDWVRKFLADNNLSLKEATKLCISRHNATRNPYIIYHFYDLLEKTLRNMGIQDRPDLIWNLDESGNNT